MLWRTHKRVEKPNWKERQGDYRDSIPKKTDRPRIWIHTVSVGEFVASQPLLRALRSELPTHEIVLSVTTSSGHQTAREAEKGLYDHLVYLPIDIARFTLSAMQRVRPDALIVLETELWMNLFWAAKTFDAKTFVVNARLSDRSFPRAKKLHFFYSTLLRMVDHVLAQSEADARRFRELGAANAAATGNLKFDQALDGLRADPAYWRQELHLDDRPVVVIGSLRAEEFEEFARLLTREDQIRWIVAPRHLERIEEFVLRLENARQEKGEPPLPVGYRSEGTSERITILDTYGELAQVYCIADLAVIGGSFQRIGMQNLVQPLALGKPVLHGPNTQNFRDVADMAQKAGASIVCSDVDELAKRIDELLADPERRKQMGEAAQTLVGANLGAADRMASAIAGEVRSKGG